MENCWSCWWINGKKLRSEFFCFFHGKMYKSLEKNILWKCWKIPLRIHSPWRSLELLCVMNTFIFQPERYTRFTVKNALNIFEKVVDMRLIESWDMHSMQTLVNLQTCMHYMEISTSFVPSTHISTVANSTLILSEFWIENRFVKCKQSLAFFSFIEFNLTTLISLFQCAYTSTRAERMTGNRWLVHDSESSKKSCRQRWKRAWDRIRVIHNGISSMLCSIASTYARQLVRTEDWLGSSHILDDVI